MACAADPAAQRPPRVAAVAFWTLLTMMILNVARATGAGATRFSTT